MQTTPVLPALIGGLESSLMRVLVLIFPAPLNSKGIRLLATVQLLCYSTECPEDHVWFSLKLSLQQQACRSEPSVS